MNKTNKIISKIIYIVGICLSILPTILFFFPIIDLLTLIEEPWQFAVVEYPGMGIFLLNKETVFWIQYTDHCRFFEPKVITSVLWHFSGLLSLFGIIIFNELRSKFTERRNDSKISLENDKKLPESVKFSVFSLQNSIVFIQIFLLTVGMFVLVTNKRVWWGFPRIYTILPQIFIMIILSLYKIIKSKFKIIISKYKIAYLIVILCIIVCLIVLLFSFKDFGLIYCM